MNLTYAELERDAYQRGDTERAELFATLEDTEQSYAEEVKALEDERDQAKAEAKEAESALADYRAEVQTRLDELYDMVKDAARVSNRETILKALTEVSE